MKILLSVMVGVWLFANPVTAATIYNSPSDFALVTTSRTITSFEGILTNGQLAASYAVLSRSGVIFSTPTVGTFVTVTAADFYGSNFTYPDDFITNSYYPPNAGGTNQLNIQFSTPVYAFGIYYGGVAGGTTGTFTLPDGTVFQDPDLPGLGSLSFVGFVSKTPISTASFVASRDSWVVESMVRATPVTIHTPEPASGSLMLAAAAVALSAGAMRSKKRRAP